MSNQMMETLNDIERRGIKPYSRRPFPKEIYKEPPRHSHLYKDQCPECGEPWKPYPDLRRCTLNKPLFIAIPPGRHIHISCPIHTSHRIEGSPIVFC